MVEFPGFYNIMYADFIDNIYDQSNSILSDFETYPLDKNEINRIFEYLENPTKKGVWFFSFDWIEEGEITSYIKKEVEDFIRNESIQSISGDDKKSRSARKISRSSLGKKEVIMEVTNHFSFIFSLFTYIYLEEIKSQTKREDIIFQDRYLQIIQVLDIEKFKEKFHDAYKIFTEEIYYEKFDPNTGKHGNFTIKEGTIVSKYNDDGMRAYSCTLSRYPLEKLASFFEKIGKIKDPNIRPEYSPEEKVFTPYFYFLEIAFPYLIKHKVFETSKVIKLFMKAIKAYKDGYYEYCIIILGLIVEDYLTQIYETFYREKIPNNLTLGEKSSLIDNEINNLSHCEMNNKSKNKIKSVPDITKLHEDVNHLLTKPEVDDVKRNQDILNLMRDLIILIENEKKQTNYIIENKFKKQSRISLFPLHIKENINELKDYRNAAAHHSSILIGQYEAQRMVYCCIRLVIWWNNEKISIDWKNDKKTIIEETLKKNKQIV